MALPDSGSTFPSGTRMNVNKINYPANTLMSLSANTQKWEEMSKHLLYSHSRVSTGISTSSTGFIPPKPIISAAR